jgi:bifunctional non-homologous end joining protein LigD
MEYGGFEGVIPAGQYGGGTVMVWDQGTWEPQAGHTDVDAGLRDGSLKFIMHGTKMKGKWALIRMGGKAANEKKPNWLLIKEHDAFERPQDDEPVTEAAPDSVVTGRSLEQIARSEDHVWNSKDTGKGKAWLRKPPKRSAMKERGAGHEWKTKLKKLPTEKQPSFVKPQLAVLAARPPSEAGWLHELKLDGYRMQARKDGRGVQMLTRGGLDWTERVQLVANEVARLAVDKVTLDGEVVVVSENGTTNFADLQASFQDGAKNVLTYFCFDLLHVDGHNARELPLIARKEILSDVLSGADADLLRVNEHMTTNGERMFHKACEFHAEGIVSKKAASQYSPGRGGDWLKMKCLHEQEFVVGGYTLPSNGSRGVGALLLGYYDYDERLIYVGRTGTGFTRKTHKILREKMEGLERESSPFASVPTEARRGVNWVKPELVAQVRFATWTADDFVRQAAFLGLRDDKRAEDVRREDIAAPPQAKNGAKKNGTPSVTKVPAMVSGMSQHAPIRLTHPEKVLDAESGMTKQVLADYYWTVAERMLPYVVDRPSSLVRCPEGSSKPCFFQKHVSTALPDGLGSVEIADKDGKVEPYITIKSAEGLASLAQMGVMEVHPWSSRNGDLEHADRLIFDLDPDEALPWPILSSAAAEVRARLKKLELESFVKTTGGKGLHVVAPIAPKLPWKTIKEFSHRVVLDMERANPTLYLTKMTKAARKGKIYLDYLRNERGATSVAPYSPRARAGAAVSMPLSWAELKLAARPVFRVAEFASWSGRLTHDPWKEMHGLKQHVTAAAMKSVGIKT